MRYIPIPGMPDALIEVGEDRWVCPKCGGVLEPDETTLGYNCEGFEVEMTCQRCGRSFYGMLRLIKSSLVELENEEGDEGDEG